MAKKISRRTFLNLAKLGTIYVGSEVFLTSCYEVQENPLFESTETQAVPKSSVIEITATQPVSESIEPNPTATSPAPQTKQTDASSTTHMPLGKARGVKPGRVVWSHNPEAARWDGRTGYWWTPENTDQVTVDEMVRQSLCQLVGQDSEVHAWNAMFQHFNVQHGKGSTSYQPGEKIAIKINLNTCSNYNSAQNNTFSSPQVISAILQQLVEGVGVKPEDIVVYDAVRYIPDCIYDLGSESSLVGVHFADFGGSLGREKCIPDPACTIHWSQDVGGSITYLPTCVAQADYIINMANLKGHGLAGGTFCAKNHCGTILAELDGKPTMQAPQGANIHGYIAARDYFHGSGWEWERRPMGSYNALVDMMGHSHLGEKTLLFLIDALYAVPHQEATVTNDARWQSTPYDGHWTSSLLLSMDGVAIDSVAYDFLINEPTISNNPERLPPGHTTENYLHEAAQADAPVSGTIYSPDGREISLSSLGVHEHWDAASTKQYSRNRGDGAGIELVKVT
jgi:hypothetical protein